MATDAYFSIISGRRTGLIAACLRGLFRLASCGYGIVVGIRNFMFDRGLKKSHSVPLKIVSIGNLTTGGTGKTPVVAAIADRLQKLDVSTGLLSRGYRSLDSGENDEKLVLEKLCPDLPHWLNADRVAGARIARGEHPDLRALVLDDAFQHRRLSRDLDVVLIDATNPWGYGYLLPRGLLRESKQGLRRADVVVITRADLIDAEEVDALKFEVARIAPGIPVIVSRFAATGWLTLEGRKLPLEHLNAQAVTACCGIGNPAGFRNTLERVNCQVKSFVTFPDHHHYAADDIDSLTDVMQQDGTSHLVMTLKDLVKFPEDAMPEITVAALLIEWDILEGEQPLNRLLKAVFR